MRSCAYAVVASRSYFTGLATLLHSLGRHNGESDDCATLVVVHHPSIPDTALTGRERDALACLVAPRRTVWHEVDTERLAVWRSVPLPAPSALSSLVKLDLFFLEDPRVDAIAFFDADMLVLRSVTFLWSPVYARPVRPPAWVLHGSCSLFSKRTGVCPRHVNAGMFAFRLPASEFGRRLLNESAKLAASNRVAALADQSVMMGALDMWHLEKYGVKRYKRNRTKVSKPRLPRPRMLWLHRDWWLNFRPKNHGQLNGWQAVHWQGAVKPWSTGVPVWSTKFGVAEQPLSELNKIWHAEFRALRASRCSRNLTATRACLTDRVRLVQ